MLIDDVVVRVDVGTGALGIDGDVGPEADAEELHVNEVVVSVAVHITGVGALVIIYAGGYLAHDEFIGRFYAYILMFMASMLGVVLSDNVATIFIFWELTSISSFLLIGYYHEEAESRTGALQALLVTGFGGLALMAGLVLMSVAYLLLKLMLGK